MKQKTLLAYITCWIILAGLIVMIATGHDGTLVDTFCGITALMFGDVVRQVHGPQIVNLIKRGGRHNASDNPDHQA